MKKTRIALISAAAILLAAALIVIGWRQAAEQQSFVSRMSQLAEEGRQRHPDLVFYDGTNEGDDPYVTVEQYAEMCVDKARKEFKKVSGDELPQDMVDGFRKFAIDLARKGVKNAGRLARMSEVSFTPTFTWDDGMANYKGAQTVEALMAEFDEGYSQAHTPQGSEIDTIFPREEWIQRALDLGIVFLDGHDYDGILQWRGYLADIRINPGKYADIIQANGLEDDANYNAYIDNKILHVAQDNMLWRSAMRKDPDSTGGFRLGDRYITTKGNQVHVRIKPGDSAHSVLMYGPRDRELTKEEKHALYYHGVAPEGIEVFYLDEDNNAMPPGSDPPRLSWEPDIAAMSEHDRHAALQKAVDFLNSDKVNEMTIVHWMTLADYTGALLDYGADGAPAPNASAQGTPPSASSSVSPSEESGTDISGLDIEEFLPPGVELPKAPGRSAEDVDAFFQFLDLHLIENADVPEEVRRGLKHRYEAYQMWRQQNRLRRQEQDSLRPQESPPPSPQDEKDEDDE